jgi:choline/glycine/proline betaine transport protein
MSVFGNSAIWFDLNIADGQLSKFATDPDALMFRFLEYMPFSSFTGFFVILIILIFFVTSADSGIFVMNSIATKNACQISQMANCFLGCFTRCFSLLLLNVGGLKALQSMTLITALPFSIVVILFIVS